MKKLIFAFTCLVLAIPCRARIITVDDDGPADFNSIQAAINDSNDGDIIIVQTGHYLENINFIGKNITLISTDPTNSDIVRETIIDGVICFRGTEDPTCLLSGFNIDGYIVGFDYNYGSEHTHATISHCLLVMNFTPCDPIISACDGTISNCVIDYSYHICLAIIPDISDCHGLIKNCTMLGWMKILEGGTCTLENCIIYNSSISVPYGATLNVSYCGLEGSLSAISGGGIINWGPGNIDNDPYFVRIGSIQIEGDYHLKSQAGRWDANEGRWTNDEVTSPCIDAGNPGCPGGDEPSPNGNRRNMGAYGGTAQASKSPADWRSIADLTNDWVIDSNDLKVFVGYWLDTGDCIPSDLDRSKSVDFNDFAIFGLQWSYPSASEPGITFRINECDMFSHTEQSSQARFIVTVDGLYIHFEDMMTANCCPDELGLEMTVEDDLITIHETEYTPGGCFCICEYPVAATLGPFEPGIYTLEVYEDHSGFIGGTTVVIDPPG